MTTDRRRLGPALAFSAVLLGALVWTAGFRLPELSRADPAWLAGVLCAHILMVAGRGLSLLSLAPKDTRGAILPWVRLAARHQGVFSVLPTGLGDLGFPYLAGRLVGLGSNDALQVLARFRLRDMVLLAIIGLTGAVLVGTSIRFGALMLLPAAIVLWFVDEIAARALRTGARLMPRSRMATFLEASGRQEHSSPGDKTIRNGLAVLVWSLSVAAVIAAFRAIGHPLGLGEALLFIAMVNAAGLVAVSIASLGVSEAGAAAALVLAGYSVRSAAGLALIARPILLASVLASSLLLDGTLGFFSRRGSSTR